MGGWLTLKLLMCRHRPVVGLVTCNHGTGVQVPLPALYLKTRYQQINFLLYRKIVKNKYLIIVFNTVIKFIVFMTVESSEFN